MNKDRAIERSFWSAEHRYVLAADHVPVFVASAYHASSASLADPIMHRNKIGQFARAAEPAAQPSPAKLRAALDAALRNRSDYVTRKLRQLDEFIEMAPPWPVRRSSVSARAEQSSKFSTRVASPGDMY